MSYRHEEKIPLTPSEAAALEARLTDRGMTSLFPQRRLHSVYFETPDYRMLSDGEEGVLPRRKLRIRHYPDAPDGVRTLETKISAVEGRFKLARRLPPAEARSLLRNGMMDSLYGVIQPVLTVTYQRRYFELDGVRITFDRQIRYGRAIPGTADASAVDPAARPSAGCRGIWQSIDEPWEVCEIKAPIHASSDHLMQVLDIPRRRFSKFANGMLAICQGRPTADASMALMAARE